MSNLFSNRGDGKLWPTSYTQTRGEINLREEFHDLLYGTTSMPQRGHWVVLRKFDMNTQSANYDEVYRTGVNGPAHPYVDTLYLTRRDPNYLPELAEASATPGILAGGKNLFFFEYNVKPTTNDQIFEIDWDNHLIKPTLSKVFPYAEKFNLKEVFPHRGDAGRIEFWICIVYKDLVGY